jgi:hypothetical protein
MEDNKKDNKFVTVVEKPIVNLEVNGGKFYFIDEEQSTWLDSKLEEIETFMNDNPGTGLSDAEKDALYKDSQKLWFEIGGEQGQLNRTEYGLVLNRPEYRLLMTLLRDKMEYDVNTLFFAIELTAFLSKSAEISKYTDDETPIEFKITQVNMTYLYTVLQQHKCKGLHEKTFLFANIIRRIGDISKVINHYENAVKEMSVSINNWVTLMDDSVTKESTNVEEAVAEEVK